MQRFASVLRWGFIAHGSDLGISGGRRDFFTYEPRTSRLIWMVFVGGNSERWCKVGNLFPSGAALLGRC